MRPILRGGTFQCLFNGIGGIMAGDADCDGGRFIVRSALIATSGGFCL
jgi:hypothetical protein